MIASYTLQLSPKFILWSILMVVLSGWFYVLGQYQAAGTYERSIQRQYDLMRYEEQKALGARRSLLEKGLRAEGERKQ